MSHPLSPCHCVQRGRRHWPCVRRTSLRLHTWYAMHPHTAAHVQRQSHHLLASRTLWAPHGCGQLEIKIGAEHSQRDAQLHQRQVLPQQRERCSVV